ncbi:MAG: amino acid adenylation domain-containing protein [Pseudonocardiaceae bacterium]
MHPESDYFALGGTSIAGISVLRRLEQDLGVTLGFADLYAHRTVRSLANRVDRLRSRGRKADHDRSITPIRRGGRLPLSFGQEQLWYLDCLNPGSPLYNIPADLRLRGPVDVAALRDALRDLATRHEVLRTCIRSDDGEPYVHVLPALPELPLLDLSTLPPAQRDREARRRIEAEAVRPFNLAEGPLLRTTLLKLGKDDHVLLLTYHHIIFDGWSPSVFFRDLFEFYRARRMGQPAELPELPIQYADFAAWQRSWLSGQRLQIGLDYWRDQLAGLRNDELPLDRPRPATQSFAGDVVEFTIDVELAARVREFSQRQGVTTFVTMLAIVDALLHRWAHLDDVVVGVGTSGRVNPATHELIGYFNNLPPFRTRVSGDLPFTELVRRCADTVAGVLDHEEMPLEKIVSAVCRRRDPARHPLFDVAYTYQNAPAPTGDLAGLTVTSYLDSNIAGIAPGTAKFDLTFGITDQDSGQMHAYIEYVVALFERETVQRLADWMPAILDAAMTDPGQHIDQLPASSRRPTGQPSVLTGVRPDPADGQLVWELVQARAAERPDHPAVVADGCAHSYREINRMANRLARRLIDAGVTAATVVPVVAGRGVELVVAWLAVAKTGGAYVPIDPDLPRQRIKEIVAETGAVVVVGDAQGTLRVPLELATIDEVDDENPSRRACPRDLAYVAYTSGSTGRPHGCEIEHRNLVDLVRWYQDEVQLSTEDSTVQVASPGFDIAALEVWASLCSGATVHFLPTALEEPGKLVRWLADHRITVAFLPTQLAEIVLTDCEWPQELCLRVLSTGGDQLRIRPPADCPFRLLNMYGPTECTVVSTAGEVGPVAEDELPDIGRPIAGTSVYVVDSRGRPVAAGELGEISVGGAAVGRGYHGLASLTAVRFVSDPFSDEPGARMYRTGDLGRLRPDGTVEFSGRIDDQVEVRGQRVEPAEVERVLVAHPSVHEALVVAVTAPSGSTRLIANVMTALPPPAENDLIAWTARALPSSMVPSQVVVHERLPRTATGKLDRKGMKEMAMSTTTLGTPTNGQHADEAAQALTRICADLLSLDRVDPDDNFFELGGDSVLGVRVAARAAKAGVFFTPQQLLQHPTLRELAAAVVTDTSRTDEGPAPVATVTARTVVRPGGPIHLTPIMHSFLDRMPHGARDFLTVHPLETTTRIDGETMRAAVDHVVARHEPLRYRFRRNSLSWRIDCAEPGTMDVFDVQILPPMSEQDELAILAADLAELRSRIDLERGPALRVRYYDRGHNRNGWVVFVIHHFVFDNMATIVLIDDLDAALADVIAGRPLDPPRPSLAWREWSQHLQDIAVSDELAGELTYWTGILRAGAATIVRADGPLRDGAAGTVIRNLEPDQVAEVLKGGPRADEAAMCAFACAMARWRGTTSAYLMTEGAATPNAYRLAGRSPAVGWFTTLHPLVLPVDPGASVLDCLPAITDRVRSVPNDGVGYGILRHLTPDSPALTQVRSLPEPEALVIHSAHGGSGFDSGIRLLRNRLDLFAHMPEPSIECFPLVLDTAVAEGALRLGVEHDGRYGKEEVESLADEVVRAFTELAE